MYIYYHVNTVVNAPLFQISYFIPPKSLFCPNKQNVQQPDEPGTIVEFEHPTDPNKFHKIICFISQIGPKKPNTYKNLYLNTYP